MSWFRRVWIGCVRDAGWRGYEGDAWSCEIVFWRMGEWKVDGAGNSTSSVLVDSENDFWIADSRPE